MPRHRKMLNQTSECDEDEECIQGGKSDGDKPGQRNAANARERARMRILSKAFSRLKTTLPWVPPDTKLSKLDTLRLATSYIAHLRTILTDDGSPPPIVHPLNLTWPFTIQQHSTENSVRSPDDWSSEEQTHFAKRTSSVVTHEYLDDSTPCSEPDLDETLPRRFRPGNHTYTDTSRRHVHFSDSLLNIG